MDPLDPDYDPSVARQRKRPPAQHNRQPHPASLPPQNFNYPARPLGPPPPPGPPPLHLAWSEHRAPNGSLYYYNSITEESRWERPPEYRPPPPPSLPPSFTGGAPVARPTNGSTTVEIRAFSQSWKKPVGDANNDAAPAKSNVERPLAMKKLLPSKWAIVLTNKDHEFFYNMETKQSVWDMPDEIADLIGQLIAEAMGVNMSDEDAEPYLDAEADGTLEARDQMNADEPSVNDESYGMGTKRKAGVEPEPAGHSKRFKSESEQGASAEPTMSQEEKAAGFTMLLREKDVSPYSTWERELPKIINDPRYALINTLKERKHLFDQYCAARVAELRDEKRNTVKDAKEIYLKLLESETTYHTRWDDFSQKFKRDERFTKFDAKERERLFNKHITSLRDKEMEWNRSETRRAKEGFLALLKETKDINADISYRRAKRWIEDDPRYQAVRSSDEREEIYREYLRQLSLANDERRQQDETERKEDERKTREEASLREREAQVRREQSRLKREISSHKQTLLKEDATTLFQTMLVDFMRSADLGWRETRLTLERDPRWSGCSALDDYEKERMFSAHTSQLHAKRLAAFHSALSDTTDITTSWEAVRGWVLQDPRARKLADTDDVDEYENIVKKEFERYQADRLTKARKDLRELLEENTFVKFHVKQAVVDTHAKAIENKEEEPKEGDEWKYINLEEVTLVLNEDKRYLQLEHFEEERDRTVKEHIRDLILRYRAEKGGTVDRTLAQKMK